MVAAMKHRPPRGRTRRALRSGLVVALPAQGAALFAATALAVAAPAPVVPAPEPAPIAAGAGEPRPLR